MIIPGDNVFRLPQIVLFFFVVCVSLKYKLLDSDSCMLMDQRRAFVFSRYLSNACISEAHIWRLKRGHAGLSNGGVFSVFSGNHLFRRALLDPIFPLSQFFSVAGKSNSIF